MTAPQVHLALNHLPVMGVLFSALVLVIGRVLRHEVISRLAIAVLVASAMAAVPVFLSGEPAEEAIEHAVGVSEPVIEAHENAARIALIAVEILGLVGLWGWFRYRRSELGRGFTTMLLVATLALSGWFAWTAHLGGQIRHPELSAANATPPEIGDDD